MTQLLFLDESGHDLKDSPYEVLAGIAVEDRDLWNLICAVQQSEETHFGRRYADQERELKAKRLLKRKVYRHASQESPIPAAERRARTRLPPIRIDRHPPTDHGACSGQDRVRPRHPRHLRAIPLPCLCQCRRSRRAPFTTRLPAQGLRVSLRALLLLPRRSRRHRSCRLR